ncbi:MAG: hypothetical protein IKW02_01560 [Clostridia bacterium]|nr:hypothetical protein [Clostridia bacterium]
MNNIIVEVAVIATVSSVLTLMLKKDRPETAYLLSLAAGVLVIYILFPSAKTALEVIYSLSGLSGINAEYIDVIVKSCIVAMITGVSASSCRDAGNSSLAAKVEIAGRVAIIVMAAPVVKVLFNVILSVIR